LPEVRSADLVFRLATQKGRPGFRLRREQGQFAHRPGWPSSLGYSPQALGRHCWPWTTTTSSAGVKLATPPPPSGDAAWDAIEAHMRQVDHRPTQRELAEMLKAKGLKPHSPAAVNRAVKAHRAEYDALFNGR
jgi:hypothetical protein